MATHEELEKAFLAELEALERFRISYTAQYPDVPLSHDDPDVRRLIEAMAFFTGRTRLSAMRSLDDSVRRIFRQHFPSLLGPSPAMAMLRASPGPAFADATVLPAGTEVVLRKPGEDDGEPDRLFRFRTLAKLCILPLRIQSVDQLPVHGRGPRLSIRLAAHAPSNQPLDELTLHVNHLDDVRSSITVLHELKAHLRKASVFYEQRPAEDASGEPCQVSFGAVDDEEALPDPFEHPLQRARMRLRFPRRDLFLTVRGLRPPRNWQYVTLRLELDERWPKKLRLTADGFELYTVPMMNVQRDLANPIECDGTKDRYPMRHPDEGGRFVPLWVIGAYRPTKAGFVPLLPGVVGVEGDSYEVVTEGRGEARRAYALFRIAGAFGKPERISVDAFWHQPGLRGVDPGDLKVGLSERFVEGVTWACSGPMVYDADSHIDTDREAQLELVSLKALRFLGKDQLVLLLRACGAHEEPLYAKLVAALADVRVTNKPFGKRSHGLKYVYELEFSMLEHSDLPRLGTFCEWLLELLAAWSAEEVLEVVARVPNLSAELRFG